MTDTHHTLSPAEYRLQETESPAAEPVSVDELKAHLRVTGSAEDAQLAALIAAARLVCENFSGKCFVTRALSLFLDRWPSGSSTPWWDGAREGVATAAPVPLRLPVGPLGEVTGIYLYPAQGAPAALSATLYHVDLLGGAHCLSRYAASTRPAA